MKKVRFGHWYPWQALTRASGARLTCQLAADLDKATLRQEAEHLVSTFAPVNQHGDDHAGGWKAISLVSSGGDVFQSKAIPGTTPQKTAAVSEVPYIESIIDGFEFRFERERVRLMQLLPGEQILWHHDPQESIDKTIVRIHLPMKTNDRVQFQISHENCRWGPGEMWYGDFSFPHRLYNGGDEDRIHLVLDIAVNDDLKALFPEAYLQNRPNRERVWGICKRLINVYTLPRYRIGYMKKKQGVG